MGTIFLIIGSFLLVWGIVMLIKAACQDIWALGGKKKWFAFVGIGLAIVFSGVQLMKDDEVRSLEKKGASAYKKGTVNTYKWLLESVVGEETPTPVPVIVPILPTTAPAEVAPPSGIAPPSGGTVLFRGVPLDPSAATAGAYLVSAR